MVLDFLLYSIDREVLIIILAGLIMGLWLWVKEND